MKKQLNNIPSWDVVASDFVKQMPEFSNSDIYSQDIIIRSLKITKFYFGSRWGDYFEDSNMQYGWFNFAAHSILVTMRKLAYVENGIAPPAVRGANTVTVADETVVYGSQFLMHLTPYDEELVTTPYGIEYLRRRDMIKQIGFGV